MHVISPTATHLDPRFVFNVPNKKPGKSASPQHVPASRQRSRSSSISKSFKKARRRVETIGSDTSPRPRRKKKKGRAAAEETKKEEPKKSIVVLLKS